MIALQEGVLGSSPKSKETYDNNNGTKLVEEEGRNLEDV